MWPRRRARRADDAEPAPAARADGRTGIIPLSNGELTLNVPANYRFYSAEEAYAYLQRNNAPAPSGAVLGLLRPQWRRHPRSPGTWATVVSYDAIGYVQPETAAGLTDASSKPTCASARQTQNRTFEGFIAQPAFDARSRAWRGPSAPQRPARAGGDLRYEQKCSAAMASPASPRSAAPIR